MGSFCPVLLTNREPRPAVKVAGDPTNLGFCEVLLLVFFREAADWPAPKLLEP